MAFGLTKNGFAIKTQQDIIDEMEASLKQSFGANIKLSPESVFGQLIGIFSEREALVWELAQDVYRSQSPSGAEGASVDNILALNNLRRLKAKATVTALENLTDTLTKKTRYPLVLVGVAGTLIPKGSVINTSGAPALSFETDADATIQAAIDAVQSIFFSNVPDQGHFSLSIEDSFGNELFTPNITWDALAAETKVKFDVVPGAGNWKIKVTAAGADLTTADLAFNATAGQVQAAIQALAGYGAVTVAGSVGAGYVITWGAICNPVTTIVDNTTGETVTITDSVQSTINNLLDAVQAKYPYTDAVVTSGPQSFIVAFGSAAPVAGQPASGEQQQSIFIEDSNTLLMGAEVTNIKIVNTAVGNPAQAVASATCTVKGPNFVAAGAMTVIGSPVIGWNTVENQLDCVTGSNLEDDTDALVRRTNLLASQANGPLQAITEKVRLVANVTQAIGFDNLTNAAHQFIEFNAVPVAGTWRYAVGFQTTPVLNYNASAAQVQTALRTLVGFDEAVVVGDMQFGFEIDFKNSLGGQGVPLGSVVSNTTGVVATTTFGLPPHSFEIVVLGGDDQEIAQAIYDSQPAGIQSFGNTQIEILDDDGNPLTISFSRPTEVPIYIVINLTTDLTSDNPKFNPGSVNDIQNDLLAIGGLVGIGGLVIGFGSDGLIGAFNDVDGITSYTMAFGVNPAPVTNTNIQMQSKQVPSFQKFLITVSYV